MDRYRKQARFAAEHEHTAWFEPLTEAIPELARLEHLFLARGGVWPWEARERELRAEREASQALPKVGQQVGHENRIIGNWAVSLFPSSKALGPLKIPEGTDSGDLDAPENAEIPVGPPVPEGVGQAVGTDQKGFGPPPALVLTKDALLQMLELAKKDENWGLTRVLSTQLEALAAAQPDTGVTNIADARKRRDREGGK
jgi:hypothetical protein